MGTSLINIDRTYGHLARDSHHHAIELLDDYNSACRHVDAGGRFVDGDTPFTPLAVTTKNPLTAGSSWRALCRTRTGDPFLTMEVLYQLS